MNSGVLLDEDVECIWSCITENKAYPKYMKMSLVQKVVGGLSFTGTLLLARRKFPIHFLSVSATPLLFVVVQHFVNIQRNKNIRCNMEKFVEATVQIVKLNRMIFEFFNFRRGPRYLVFILQKLDLLLVFLVLECMES